MASSERSAPAAAESPRLVPLQLRDVDAGALAATAIYLSNSRSDGSEEFHLYRAPDVPFTAAHYERLLGRGVETVYVPAPSGGRKPEEEPDNQFVDKRRHRRSRLWCAARLLVEEGGRGAERTALEAQVFDISCSGLGVLCKAHLALGAIVTVYLEVPGWGRRPLRTRVRRCQQRPAWCEVGLELF